MLLNCTKTRQKKLEIEACFMCMIIGNSYSTKLPTIANSQFVKHVDGGATRQVGDLVKPGQVAVNILDN